MVSGSVEAGPNGLPPGSGSGIAGMPRLFALWILLAALAAAPTAARGEGPQPFALTYGMYWGGFHIANVWLTYAPEADSYRSELTIETVGLADALLRYSGNASSEGQRNGADQLVPKSFQFRDSSRKTTHATDVTFDPARGAAVAIEMRTGGEPRSSEVPPELWLDALDPLTAFLQLREDIANLQNGARDRLAVPVLDGRRRYDMVAWVTGRERVDMAGRQWDALRVELAIKRLAGFDEEDWEEAGYGDEGIRAQALLSEGARLPIQITTLNTPISLVFNLRQHCIGADCETVSG